MNRAPNLHAEAPELSTGAALDRSFVRGIAWTAAMRSGGQMLGWASNIIVARLLTPADYGLVGMATIYFSFVMLICEFGVGTAVVTLRDLSPRQIAQLNSASVMIGLGAFLLSLGLASPMGKFFETPNLPAVLIVLSTTFVILSFRSVPYALLQKQLRFRELAINDGIHALLLAVSLVGLALTGMGYWTLVLGRVVSALVATVLLLARCRHGFAWPGGGSIRNAITLSRQVLISRLAWYVYSNADFLVAGKMLGKEALGAYSLAWTLASMPVEKISLLVFSVTPSIFSAGQDDPGTLRRYLLTLSEGLAMVTFPVAVGLALVAREAVPLVLGPKWEVMIVPLMILGVYACFRSIIPFLPQLLIVTGNASFTMWNSLFAAAILPASFLVGSRWGINGIAATWIAVHPFVVLPLYWKSLRAIDLSLRAYARCLWPAASCTLLMTVGVLLLQAALPRAWDPAARLALVIGVGASTYGWLLWTLHGSRVGAFRQLLRTARGAGA